MRTETELREAVEDGISFLDDTIPDWRERVNRDKLNIGSCHNCVLGQLGGFVPLSDTYHLSGMEADYGFDAKGSRYADDINREYAILTRLWKEAL